MGVFAWLMSLSELFAFVMVIIAVIALVNDLRKK